MSSLLIFIIVVLVVLGLVLYALSKTPIASPMSWFVQVLAIIVAALFIMDRAGLL